MFENVWVRFFPRNLPVCSWNGSFGQEAGAHGDRAGDERADQFVWREPRRGMNHASHGDLATDEPVGGQRAEQAGIADIAKRTMDVGLQHPTPLCTFTISLVQ